jgi:hypothetical protein
MQLELPDRKPVDGLGVKSEGGFHSILSRLYPPESIGVLSGCSKTRVGWCNKQRVVRVMLGADETASRYVPISTDKLDSECGESVCKENRRVSFFGRFNQKGQMIA